MVQSDDGPVGIIAGGHNLPVEIAQSLRDAGQDYFLVGIQGEAETAIEDHPHIWLKWGQIGTLFKQIEQRQIRRILCIGSVTKRPDFKSIKLDFGAVAALPEILKIVAGGGDEGILNRVAGFFERRGLQLLSVADVAPSLVIGGDFRVSTPNLPNSADDISLAANAAHAIGQLDAGQGAVVANGRIIAMEGPEGTDQMLERVASIREQKRAQWDYGKQGVLLKRARPGQDLRFDMPTIGPRTIERVKTAGLAGIVCGTGQVLCASKERTLKLAQENGIFIEAMTLDGEALVGHT